MQDEYGVALNTEQNPIDVRFAAVEQLTYLKRKPGGFWSEATPVREGVERSDLLFHSLKPAEACLTGVLLP